MKNITYFPRFNVIPSSTDAEKRRKKLQRDVKKFLKKGGKIQQIPTGVITTNDNLVQGIPAV